MGIMSSKDLKPEAKSENNQVSSEPKEERGRLYVFMKEGGCEESFESWVDCDMGKDKCREPYSMLEKCMKARSDYFEPYLALKKSTLELTLREVDAFLHAKPKNREELFDKFMTRGGCKEVYMAWRDSFQEAKKNKETLYTPALNTLLNCMEAHSDYYQRFLVVVKNSEEHYDKELNAFFDAREQAEAEAKG